MSGLHGVVRGYAIEDVLDGRQALQPLMMRYGFDAIERDGKLVFRMRGGLKAFDVNPDGFAINSDVEGTVEYRREAEAEMAGRVRLRFVQSDADHDIVAEEAVLPDDRTHAVAVNEMALSMTRGEGRQTVERWLSESRMSRETARFALPPSQLNLGAGDVVRLKGMDQQDFPSFRIDRIEQAEMQLVDAVRIEPDVYAPAEITDDGVNARPFIAPTPVLPVLMDLPLITGAEAAHAPYLALSADPWAGNVAIYVAAQDEDYALRQVISDQAVIGFTESPLWRASSGIWDEGRPLRVNLIDGFLESRPREALLNGANLAAIGDGTLDNWEVIQFSDATLEEGGIFNLSGRLRGQLGTDSAMPEVWPEGSVFVLLDDRISQLNLLRNERRVSKHYRIGPASRGYEDPAFVHQVEAFDGNGLRPYAPAHLKVVSKTDADSFSWVRRTRVDGDDWGGLDVPLGEETEAYLVRVRSNGVLLREETTATPIWSYSETAKAADGVSGTYVVEVAQVSAIFGPGLFASCTAS
ncbi:phage tail protein [Ruegeria arenilitoris]|uniref:phage tail protein n=1 Tax=Ruegeria arenilitoris TaxID=1173585 RepID=UPI003464E3AE